MQVTAAELAADILKFLAAHAKPAVNYDPAWDEPAGQYRSPDAGMLYVAAQQLAAGLSAERVFSSWDSGGYRPLQDRQACAWHDRIVAAVNGQDYVIPPSPAP